MNACKVLLLLLLLRTYVAVVFKAVCLIRQVKVSGWVHEWMMYE
jgi:hypothetical protein